jgi:molecular chaperone DnaK
LTEAEIEKMIKDAEANADSDKRQRELIETRNTAESAVHEIKRELAESGVSEDVKSTVNEAVVAVEAAIVGEDVDSIKQSVDRLMEAARPVMEAKSNQQAQQSAPADDGVVDAEFTETK